MKKFFFIVFTILFSVKINAKDFLIESVHIPVQLISKAENDLDKLKYTEPVFFMEVYSVESGEILLRTDGQGYGGNKTDFDFGKYGNKLETQDGDFPIAVKFLIGSKTGVERGARAVAGGTVAGTIGAIIGGIGAGICTGGLGGAAGAVIGGAIGAAIGGSTGALAPVADAKEVFSFRFDSESSFAGTHKKKIDGNDILTDGQEATITIKEK